MCENSERDEMTKEQADKLADSIRRCILFSIKELSDPKPERKAISDEAFALLSERIQLAFENVIPEEPTVYGTHKTRG